MSGGKHAFISYCHADAAWVRALAENLHRLGVELWFDEWEITAGDVLVHKLDEGILSGRAGVLVVSPESLSRPIVREECAAMWSRAVAGQQRLIPVLYLDAEMPPMLASRVWVDFRNADGAVYEARVAELVRALKGERKGPPPRGGPIQPPPGTKFRAEGAMSATLRIASDGAELSIGDERVAGPVLGADHRLDDLLWRQQRALVARDGVLLRGAGGEPVEAVMVELGRHLASRFVPEEVAGRLAAAMAEATRLNAPLELGLEIADDRLADLPWELLRLPSGIELPLALHPRVDLYRLIPAGGAALMPKRTPRPLRILVAIGSPDVQNTGGELLDMEAELGRILDAAETARRDGTAAVRILETGSVEAIRAALDRERWHVLYISCHARPGKLILEDAEGGEQAVSAKQFWQRALPSGRGVPMIVLAGCSTGRGAGEEGGKALPAVARELNAKGIPTVLAMQGPVSDRYATELAGELFASLATAAEPLPLRLLSAARRKVESDRQQSGAAMTPPPEWHLPALHALNGAPQPLLDTLAPADPVTASSEPKLDRGVVVRRIGDLVGRRREIRVALRALRSGDTAGVVLHGIGGVGKSTLAAHVMHRMAEGGCLLVSLAGQITPERVLGEVGARLLDLALDHGLDERHVLRRAAVDLREAKYEWEQRFELLDRQVLGAVPLVLLLDNFEDNLDAERNVTEPLAEMLARWAEHPDRSRLLFTSRYPFTLPRDTETALTELHLGPLSLAETRKLVWRLPGLDALPAAELQRAYETVGGHPRTLEYLDALLRGGKARFTDVEQRLTKALRKRGIADPARWRATTRGDLDRALAETVTLAADDVLLDDLLARLAAEPLAHRLLIGTSVYRVPVDEVGLQWQIAESIEAADGKPPPAPDALATARDLLARMSLLAPIQQPDDETPRWLVHRWTAHALAQRLPDESLVGAHQRASRFWRWRVDTRPQSKHQDLLDCLEARFHYHAADELDGAFATASHAVLQLEIWGAWREAERLIEEMVGWFDPQSVQAAQCLGQLANLSLSRGDHDQALGWYRQAIAIAEQAGDRGGIATSYHQLGNLEYLRGNYDQALDWYCKSLAIKEQLGNRAGMATSYHQLGMVVQDRGDYDQALDWYRKSLAIEEQLGNRAGMASSYGQLGIVAQLRGDYDRALDWYRKALALFGQLGDRDGMATSYHQLGMVAQHRGDYDQALDWYRKSLAIFEQLGNRAGMASTYHQLGMVAQHRGDYDQALDWYRKAIAIFEQLGNHARIATSYYQLGMVAQHRGDYDQALDWYCKALAIEEQLGDRAGMATSLSQIGLLHLEQGRAEEAVPLTLQSLAIRLELQVPQAAIDLRALGQERGMLGPERFAEVLREHLDDDGVTNVMNLLEWFEREGGDPTA